MTIDQIRSLAELAIQQIRRVKPGQEYAGRRGHCVGCRLLGQHRELLFRRTDGRVRLEVWDWPTSGGGVQIEHHALPPDLQRRVALVIDGLPGKRREA